MYTFNLPIYKNPPGLIGISSPRCSLFVTLSVYHKIPSDFLDAHLNDVRVWSLDSRTWRISLTYTTPVRGHMCMRLFLLFFSPQKMRGA